MVYIELITSRVKSRLADYKDKKTRHILPRNTTCSEELKSNMLLIINHELYERCHTCKRKDKHRTSSTNFISQIITSANLEHPRLSMNKTRKK